MGQREHAGCSLSALDVVDEREAEDGTKMWAPFEEEARRDRCRGKMEEQQKGHREHGGYGEKMKNLEFGRMWRKNGRATKRVPQSTSK